ncbi:nucleolar protein 6-like [Babylonia areolata]|uniref:nucleolar protein 6-like n=1 Tax=Babylonia areolata TaxID=304850 RepID=UPI003FD5D5E3
MSTPGEMKSTKKRPHSDDAEGNKAKRKKKSQEDEGLTLELEQAAMMGEIPSLFNLQMQELLKEARMKKKRAEKLSQAIEKLKDFLMNLSRGKEHKLHPSQRAWLKDVKLPVEEGQTTKGCFQFLPPVRVYLGGSTPLNTCVQPSKAADVFLEMPKECFQAKDWLNHRYVRKRAMYLSTIAVALKKTSLAEDLQFMFHQGNVYKPVLVLNMPVEGKGKALTVHLHAIPEEGAFKMNRFHITKNNVRPRWFSAQDDQENGNDEGSSLPSTPIYNTSILQDVCYDANASFLSQRLSDLSEVQDAIALLKIWAHQRELDVGFGSFSGFLLSMFVCQLLSEGVLLPSMNSYQVLRLILLHLSKSRWLENPVVLCRDAGKGGRPTLDQFLQEFDVVFVDVTGYVNLALGMTKGLYSRACQEAELAVRCLAGDEFDHLFMTPCPFHLKFDLTYTVSFTEDTLQETVKKLQLTDQALDHGGPVVSLVIPRILDLLDQGLGDRVLLLQTLPVASPVWSVTEDPVPRVRELSVGLLLHKSNSLRLVDRGPAANVPEALDFRQFWGEKSELRRFKDGGISEAVVWALTTGLSQKRSVCGQIVAHVLNRHAAISPGQLQSHGRMLDSVLHVPRRIITQTDKDSKRDKKASRSGAVYGTGEERIYHIRQVLEDLGKTLRRLDLPLMINAVSGIDPVFRFSEVFPAHPAVKQMTSEDLLKGHNPLPLYTPAMTVICSLEGSGHWPEDVDRIRDLKTLYLMDLAEKLQQKGLKVAVSSAHLDVLQSGFVFRLKLGVKREVAVLRMVHTPEGMLRMEDTPQALAIDAEISGLPEMTTLLQGVQQDHPSFCVTVRLVKRWVSAQMLLGHVPELMVERMVMQLFTAPHPFTLSSSGNAALLKLVSSGDCKVETFCDKVTPPPPAVIMNWWKNVAAESLKVLVSHPESMWKVIFKPPLDVFDIVIHLSPTSMARRHQSLEAKDVAMAKYPDVPRSSKADRGDTWLPVVSFDPAEMLLRDLEGVYGDFALFFHDRYGGEVISVLFKPEARQRKKFEASSLYGQKPSITDGEPALTFDMDAMVETISNMGGDLVKKIVQPQAV